MHDSSRPACGHALGFSANILLMTAGHDRRGCGSSTWAIKELSSLDMPTDSTHAVSAASGGASILASRGADAGA